MPKVEIVNVETMLLADSMTSNHAQELSGVNLLFLDPEYYDGDHFNSYNDVWSVGVILYLLITGGVDGGDKEGDHNEAFQFLEPVWNHIDL